MAKRLLYLLALFLCGLAAPAAAVPDGDLLLVDIAINGRTVDDYHDVIRREDGQLLVPVAVIFRAAEARFQPLGGLRWRLALPVASTSLVADAAAGTIAVNGEPPRQRPGALALLNDQLLVADSVLAETFGIRAELGPNQLTLQVESERPLPIDRRLMRERRWRNFRSPGAGQAVTYQPVANPYRAIGMPRGSLTTTLTQGSSAAGSVLRSSGLLAMEAGWLTHRVFLAADAAEGFSAARWRAGRESPAGRAFGIRGLYEAGVGDLVPRADPLVGSPGQGRGLRLSGTPLNRTSLFATTVVEGDALHGSDAELYRGAQLIDFQRVGADGRYRFEDLPLRTGDNAYRVVLYGPQGEKRTRQVRRRVASGLLPPGELHWGAHVLDIERTVLAVGDPVQEPGRSVQLRGIYGLARSLTVGAFAGHRGNSIGVQRAMRNALEGALPDVSFGGLTLRPQLPGVDSEWVIAHQSGGAQALALSAGSRLVGLQLQGSFRRFDEDFVSPQRFEAGRRVEQALDVRSGLGVIPGVGLSFGYEAFRFDDGTQQRAMEMTLRHGFGGLRLSHELLRLEREALTSDRYQLLGVFGGRQWDGRFNLAASGGSGGPWTFDNAAVSLRLRGPSDANLGLNANYAFRDGSYSGGVNYTRQLPFGSLSLSGSVTKEGAWSAGLTLTLAGGLASGADLMPLQPGQVEAGSLQVRVFHDRDGDGRYAPEVDLPIPGAGLLIDGRAVEARTNDEGRLLLPDLSTDSTTQVSLDVSSLSDPFLVSAVPRRQLMLRPGMVRTLSFALQDAAGVSGRVLLASNEGSRPLSGVTVVARKVDGRGEEMVATLSGGFYSFERLAPGAWRLSLSPGELPDGFSTSERELRLLPGELASGVKVTVTGAWANE